MNFNKHLDLEGQHAILGASNYHWLNYNEEKLINTYRNLLNKEKGVRLHEYAASCIRMNQKLPRSKKTLNMYVNDAVSFGMTPEQPLFYSEYCFGTADAISFRNNKLRIYDYKTGAIPAKMEQLKIYAALFCLEYKINPLDIEMIDLRIYQSNEVLLHSPEGKEILDISNKIVAYSKIISDITKEEL